MVELTFKERLRHFVSLALLRSIAAATTIDDLAVHSANSENHQNQLSYLTVDDLKALKAMPLLDRGRLSVQPVNEAAWVTISKLAEKGGWSDQAKIKPTKIASSGKPANRTKPTKTAKRKLRIQEDQAPLAADGSLSTELQTHHPGSAPRRSKRLKN